MVGPGRPKMVHVYQYQYCVFGGSTPYVCCVYTFITLFKVVSNYDLSVLSMSVMGFQKKIV